MKIKYFFKNSQIIRMVAWMRTFIHTARRHEDSQQKDELTAIELSQAYTVLI